ncbi:hypothetical protein BJY01DRAFT_20918 [Aspergillus pseudoustus]|uniref:Rhodopsin domain-containing protein n=1 Tax=Aspergillus pseudoustus TaxID=1810923 RepID=A0ABR4JK42_9EURO
MASSSNPQEIDASTIDFSTHAPKILAITGTMTGLACLLVVLRCYVRVFVLRRFYVEDWIMVVCGICCLGVQACFVGETHVGLGQFSRTIAFRGTYGKISQWIWWHSLIVVLGISLVKISIGFFLLRFATQKKWLKWLIIGSLIFLTAFTMASLGTLIFQCVPVRAAWDFELRAKPTTKCFSTHIYLSIGRFNASINIITDFLYATLPVFMFYNVQVNRRTKASLMGILGLGYFACAAAIVKAVLQGRVFGETELYRYGHILRPASNQLTSSPRTCSDDTYHIWNYVELAVGVIAACFPTIKPLVKSIIGSTRSLTSYGRSRKRTGDAYYGPNSHALSAMARSRQDPEEQKYHVQIHANHPSLSGSDGGSEENLARDRRQSPINSRIVQTTEVIVHSEDSADIGPSGIGPRRTVEDRI